MPYVGVGVQKVSESLTQMPMVKAYIAIGISLVLCISVAVVGLHHSNRRFNSFKKSTIRDVHESTTSSLINNIDPENIKKYLRLFTKEPHLAGSEANKHVSMEIEKAWKSAGLEDVHRTEYEVLLSYPDFENPNTVTIKSKIDQIVFQSKGVSPPIINSEQSHKHAGHQWLAYSSNGTVTADVVYVNYGTATDFKNLNLMKVDLKGKIALMRYGYGFRGDKVHKAILNGAVGAIIFSDPLEVARDGTSKENVYPNKIWMPQEGVQRGSLMHGDGDPLSPYYPSRKGLFKSRTINEVLFPTAVSKRPLDILAKYQRVLPKIPVMPVSYTTAREILSRLRGRTAPTDWQGHVGGNITYKLGPGLVDGATLTIDIRSSLRTKTISNVIGYIRGAQEPDRYVMLGNHYDAWVYGSLDPNSGTAVLAEVARAMKQTINETSWSPARTIVFNAWDAEEYGLIGSTEFVEEFVDILQQRAIVYINMDTIQGNSSLHVNTIPSIEHVAVEASKKIPNPSQSEIKYGRPSVYDTWVKVFPDKRTGRPQTYAPGGGSDHASFLNYAGVPVINFNYKNYSTYDTYPLYHTLYETPFTNTHLLDVDNLSVHRAIGQYWAELARTFSDDVVLPINITNVASVMKSVYLPQLKTSLAGLNVSRSEFEIIRNQYVELKKSVEDLRSAGYSFEKRKFLAQYSFSQNPYDTKAVDAINNRLISTERCFINPRGISKSNPSGRHVLFTVSDSDSYSNTLMAGVVNAIELYNAKPSLGRIREVANQISIIQYSVICIINTLKDFI